MPVAPVIITLIAAMKMYLYKVEVKLHYNYELKTFSPSMNF